MARRRPRRPTFRMVIDVDMLRNDLALRYMPLRSFGVLWRLLPYFAEWGGIPEKGSIARLCGLSGELSPRVMRVVWRDIEPFFVRADRYLWLKPQRWFFVESATVYRQTLKSLRLRLMRFWGNACAYCGEADVTLHIDHIIPFARGGTNDITNLTLACRGCNSKKRMQTAAEFGFPHVQERATKIL